jgi:hypothetical protein
VPSLQWPFGVEPDTGTVYYVLPQGEARFANSSIDLWLRTLHHYGLHVSESEILSDPDDREDEALAELSMLADELKKIDPPAFDGYGGYIWAEFLDRWLWQSPRPPRCPKQITHRVRRVKRLANTRHLNMRAHQPRGPGSAIYCRLRCPLGGIEPSAWLSSTYKASVSTEPRKMAP